MTYYYKPELRHWGIKGQKWGIRRFQNEDGSLTPAGKERYGVDENGRINSAEGARKYILDQRDRRYRGREVFDDMLDFENEIEETKEFKELREKDRKLIDEMLDDNFDEDYTEFYANRDKMAVMRAEHSFKKMLDKYGEYTLSAFLNVYDGGSDKDLKKRYIRRFGEADYDV